MIADLTPLDEDPDYPCHDGEHHRYEHDGAFVRCTRGCGAEVPIVDLYSPETPS